MKFGFAGWPQGASGSASALSAEPIDTNGLIPVFRSCELPIMGGMRPHRKLVKHYYEPGDLHELTLSCYRRLPHLTNDPWRQRLVRCIGAA